MGRPSSQGGDKTIKELQTKVNGLQEDLDVLKGNGGTEPRPPLFPDRDQQSEDILARLTSLEDSSRTRSREYGDKQSQNPRKPMSEFKSILQQLKKLHAPPMLRRTTPANDCGSPDNIQAPLAVITHMINEQTTMMGIR